MRKKKQALFINSCIALFFILCVILPILSMLSRITPAGIHQVISSPQFGPAVWNSVATAFTAALLSILLALAAAWCVERTAIKGKAIYSMIFLLPMLIPSISHALGLIALFGNNGILTNLLQGKWNIYGFGGIVAGSVMYSFPVAFLMFSNILRCEDGLTYKAAAVLGIPPGRQFRDITLPYLKRTILSAFFAVFTMVITDYGVPLMIRGKRLTLSVMMYEKAVSMMDYGSGSVVGALLLLPAIATFLVDMWNPEKGQAGFVSEPVEQRKRGLSIILAYLFSGLVGICVLLPILSFCIMAVETKYPVDPTFTLYHVQRAFDRGAGEYLFNSLGYAFLAAAFGTLFAFGCAYMTAREKGSLHRGLHLISITAMAIPGIVLGLSYVIFFHRTPIYGTVAIIVLANSVHFFASPYLMMYNTLEKVNPNLEAVGESLGIGRLHLLKDIIFPKVQHTLCEMFSYFFVNSMMTISAVSFLVPPAPKPVALLINQFEAQLLMESAAVVSVLILFINAALKVVLSLAEQKEDRLREASGRN